MTQLVDVFIASPNDVKTERGYAEEAIQQVSARTREALNIALHPVRWENFLPAAVQEEHERIQDRFNARVTKCGIFIGILYQRYGTEIDESRKISGTEEEFETAIKNRRNIETLSYFRQSPPSIPSDKTQVAQAAKLNELRSHLERAGLLHFDYRRHEEFRRRIIIDLFDVVIRISTEAERREQLRSFFRFGIDHKRESPSVILGYPAIHTHAASSPLDSRMGSVKSNWQERLLPNVVYEDFKAIQKIEAAVRATGVQDVSSVTLDSPKLRGHSGNRIWLCVPRNELAQKQLDSLGNRVHFRFKRVPEEPRPHIIWTRPGKKSFIVQSPLAQYLIRQKRPKRSLWGRELGDVVARDFAVISRFALPGRENAKKGEPFYHYFIAGIRGLGTWGAAWYIDRKPDELYRLSRSPGKSGSDIQLLLEVTFSNHRILSVKNVTDQSPVYFRQQLLDEEIDSAIRLYRPPS